MRKEDVKIGMKVVPFQKTGGTIRLDKGNIEQYLNQYFNGQPWLYVIDIISDDKIHLWNCMNISSTGDIFKAEDFEPYIEPKQTQKETQQMKKEEPAQLNKREKGRKVKELREKLGIKRMLRNGDTLIVWFEDGTEKGYKVVEKCVGKDEFDWVVGVCLAYFHNFTQSKSVLKEAIDKEVKSKAIYVK